MMDTATRPRMRATRLADVLKAQGRKRRWLAEQVGVSESFISRIVAGERMADAALAERIAAILGTPIFFVFDMPVGTDSMPPSKDAAA